MSRSRFVGSVTALAGAVSLESCTSPDGAYVKAVAATWRPSDMRVTEGRALQRELVRYATLAPSSHNTQCWTFKLDQNLISILPDFTRRCPAVDPDDHHLFVSLGCAAENMVLAGHAHGLHGDVRYDAGDSALRIAFEPARPVASSLFDAIPARQCSRAGYDGRALGSAELQALERAGRGAGSNIILLTERTRIEQLLEYVVSGNTAQLNDPAFMDELRHWIRFNDAEAIVKGDGLSTRASGNPQLPRWLGDFVFKFALTAKSENEKYVNLIRSSAGIAIFVSDIADRAHWVETGRCYERFALQATALGICTSMINQPVEVASLRPEFAHALGIGNRRPDLVVRFGRGPEMPRSLRRPVNAVLV